MNNTGIVIEGLTFSYGNKKTESAPVLDNISFTASGGERIGLIGANGAGKSTFLKMLVGLLMPDRGTVYIHDLAVTKQNLAGIRKMTGYVFQDSDNQLFMTTVGEDVAFGPKNYGLAPDEVRARTENALEKAGIPHLMDKPVWQLSGGEKKLAAVATVLSMSPDIILLDEPSAALDPRNRRNLISIINELPQLKILASHDLDFILDTTDRVVLLSGGGIAADGPSEEILTDEKLLTENGLELPLSMQRR